MESNLYKTIIHNGFTNLFEVAKGISSDDMFWELLGKTVVLECSDFAKLVVGKPIPNDYLWPPWNIFFLDYGAILGEWNTGSGGLIIIQKEEGKFRYTIFSIFRHKQYPKPIIFGRADGFCVTENGKMLNGSQCHYNLTKDINNEISEQFHLSLLSVVINTIAYLNRNKNYAYASPGYWPQRTKRFIEKVAGGNSPSSRYYTLVIKDRDGNIIVGGKAESEGLLRLHHVRGHPKYFTNFFNRGPQVVYCPPHMKGNPKRGIIVKDYKIEVPRQEAIAPISPPALN